MSAALSPRARRCTARDVFFAMPVQDGQLVSGDWRPGLVADRDYAGNAPLSASLAGQGFSDEQLVYQIMLQVRGMLNKANIHINEDADDRDFASLRAAALPRIWRRASSPASTANMPRSW